MWRELVRATSTVCPASVVLWVSENGAWKACGCVRRERGSQRQGKVVDNDRAGVGIADNKDWRVGRDGVRAALVCSREMKLGKGEGCRLGKLLRKGLWKGDEIGVEMGLNREGTENAGALWEER